jgi:hypothetical protein
MAPKRMRAKYEGRCRTCGGRIHRGEGIQWSKEAGATHLVCPNDTSEYLAHRAARQFARDEAEYRAECPWDIY